LQVVSAQGFFNLVHESSLCGCELLEARNECLALCLKMRVSEASASTKTLETVATPLQLEKHTVELV
jgi:hypothetical protein